MLVCLVHGRRIKDVSSLRGSARSLLRSIWAYTIQPVLGSAVNGLNLVSNVQSLGSTPFPNTRRMKSSLLVHAFEV